MYRIVRAERFSPQTFLWEVEAPDVARSALPGHFIMLRLRDGAGMCGSCRVTVGDTIRFACVDGPEFDAHQVDFAELMSRQRRFRCQVGVAMGDYRKVCEVKLQLFENERRDLGVEILTNKVVGKTFTIAQLMGEMGYDAVFVGTGAGTPSFPGIPGEYAAQVYSANELLTRVNLMGGDRFPYEDTPVHLGQKVCVIGAGNTAMDCLRVARRTGAAEVRCIYRRTEAEAPARSEELRHAKEEGITCHWLQSPTEILVDADANVTHLKTQAMRLGEPDAAGRSAPATSACATSSRACARWRPGTSRPCRAATTSTWRPTPGTQTASTPPWSPSTPTPTPRPTTAWRW